MLRRKKEGIEWLEFELLADVPELTHGVFLRHGGISTDQFGALNLSDGFGDDKEKVLFNTNCLLETIQIDKLVSAYHVHGCHVEHVDDVVESQLYCDGLVTGQCGLGLMAKHADCQAALFYDPIHKVVGAVHAGWRGQVQDIYRKTVEKMHRVFGTQASDLLVCISPSLGPLNSEFIHYKSELPPEFWQFQIKPTYFDLWAISRYQLESCGVLRHHIEIAEIDTFANPQDFFSYRREKRNGHQGSVTGAHGTVIALQK